MVPLRTWEKNMETKSSIRKELLEKRKDLSESTREADSEIICKSLQNMSLIQDEKDLFVYHPKTPEVSLLSFISWALQHGKNVYFPRVLGDDMDFYQVKDLSELEKGNFGVYEPKLSCPKVLVNQGICLIPGVGFDFGGNRIGYGRGYYDKYLSRYNDLYRLGIAYECQMVERIPKDPLDATLHAVLTPAALYEFDREED